MLYTAKLKSLVLFSHPTLFSFRTQIKSFGNKWQWITWYCNCLISMFQIIMQSVFWANKQDYIANFNQLHIIPDACLGRMLCLHLVVFIVVRTTFIYFIKCSSLIRGRINLAEFNRFSYFNQALGFCDKLVVEKDLLVGGWRSFTAVARCNTGHCDNTN